ncbi:MAG: hypothetical protein V3S40_02125, partial [Kiloniellales bacterium]
MTGAFRELPFDPDDSHVEAARVIIDAMDLDLDEKALVRLLRNTRHAHRMVLSDWKRRNDPGWQPKKRLQDNWHKDEPTYDYGKDAGVGFDEHRWIDPRSGKTYFGWQAWWRENWGRARSNPGRFRGTDIAAPPLVAIYYLCNRWWRETLGTPFRPDFRAIDLKVPDAKNLPELNDAA